MTTLPQKPWHTVNIDFCGPFPTGEYLLVIVDAYSLFSQVKIVISTAGKGTIEKLDRIFVYWSSIFKTYMQNNGTKHQKI